MSNEWGVAGGKDREFDNVLPDQHYYTPNGAVIDDYGAVFVPGTFKSQDSSVGIATGYGMDGRGLIHGRGKTFLVPGVHPAYYPIGRGGSFRAAGT
jgi:hypothetical protein